MLKRISFTAFFLLAFSSPAWAHGAGPLLLLLLGPLMGIPVTVLSFFIDPYILRRKLEFSHEKTITVDWQINLTAYLGNFIFLPFIFYWIGTLNSNLPSTWEADDRINLELLFWGPFLILWILSLTVLKALALRLFYKIPLHKNIIGSLLLFNTLSVIIGTMILFALDPSI